MNRRTFTKKLFGFGAAFSVGSFALPKEVKSQILKPVINGYCQSYWDEKVAHGIARIKKTAPGLMIGDTHLHSTHSDGRYSPLQILSRAHMVGLDFLVLTEHITPKFYGVDCPVSSFKKQLEAVQFLRDQGINPPEVYPAVEISTSEGHVIAVFPKVYYSKKDFPTEFRRAFSVCGEKLLDAASIIGRVKSLGGRTIIPHPGAKRSDKPFGIPFHSLETHLQGLPDGVEDMNTGNSVQGQFGARFGLSSIGASDDHFKALLGTSVTTYNGDQYSDLTGALAEKATIGFQAAQVFQPLLKASLLYYSFHL